MISFILALIISAAVGGALIYRTRLPADLPAPQQSGPFLAALLGAWLVALLAPAPVNLLHKGAVVFGLTLGLIGLGITQSGFLPRYAGHAFWLISYALYGLALAAQTRAPGWVAILLALFLLALAALLYAWLHPVLGELRSAVIVYGGLLLLAAWQAVFWVTQAPGLWTAWAALLGVLLLAAGLTLDAQARWRAFRPAWAAASLPVWLLANLAIAWSVWTPIG